MGLVELSFVIFPNAETRIYKSTPSQGLTLLAIFIPVNLTNTCKWCQELTRRKETTVPHKPQY